LNQTYCISDKVIELRISTIIHRGDMIGIYNINIYMTWAISDDMSNNLYVYIQNK